MSKPFFVYTIYIASTPEKVFKALTDTDVTAKFWFGNAVTSDWKVDAPIEFRREGKLIVQGKVLEYDPPRRLSYTFHSMHKPFYGAEQPSRVVIDLERQKDQVKLTSRTTTSPKAARYSMRSAKAGRSCSRASRAISRPTACCTRPGTRKSRPPRRDRFGPGANTAMFALGHERTSKGVRAMSRFTPKKRTSLYNVRIVPEVDIRWRRAHAVVRYATNATQIYKKKSS